MFVKSADAARRRFRRRVKAAASIAIALAAGTFLACQRGLEHLQNASDARAPDDAQPPKTSNEPDTPAAIPTSTALVRAQDAGAGGKSIRDAAVDVNEHRKGMPVPDNLLE